MRRKAAIEEPAEERESPSGALARGLAILDAILAAPQPLTLSELAAQVKLDQSTTLRLLRTLETAGRVMRSDDNKRYAAAPSVIYPLPLLHPLERVRREIQPILEQVARTFGETAVLILYSGLRRMVVDAVHSPNSLSPFYSRRLEGPLHATASGKAMLVDMTAREREVAMGAAPYSAETPNTKTDFASLNAEIDRAAQQGFAIARDEQIVGLTAIAANITGHDARVVGCVCITGHSKNFDEARIDELGAELVGMSKLTTFQVPSLQSAAQFLGNS